MADGADKRGPGRKKMISFYIESVRPLHFFVIVSFIFFIFIGL